MSSQVIFVSSEASPLVKTGGLADVCGSLPGEIQTLGLGTRIVLPWYKTIEGTILGTTMVPLSGREIKVTYGETSIGEVPVLLVGHPPMFHRDGLYHENGKPYPDNDRRFILFSKAAVLGAEQYFEPDGYHAHDWFTGIIPMLLKYHEDFPNRPCVYTIHNLRHQGEFPVESFRYSGISWDHFRFDTAEHYGQLNLMKAGISTADHVTTVSPTYAEEIQTKEYGGGLEEVLRYHSDKLSGILNGIDTGAWNPSHDSYLEEEEQFDIDNLSGKYKTRSNLLREAGLPEMDRPLIGLVGRLVPQKGIDLVLDHWPALKRLEAQWIVLGTGDTEFENGLRKIENRCPEMFSAKIMFSERWAHRIEAGADLFCMPSRFEPCGLNQIYSMAYGTVPIVHRTGGLADTVIDPSESEDKATGFTFKKFSGDAFVNTVKRALNVYHNQPNHWSKIQENGMKKDFSWQASAKKYLRCYIQQIEGLEPEVSLV